MRPSLHGLEVAVVDVETTGLFPNGNDRIVEIAVVRTTLGTAEQRVYSTLVNPSRDAGPTRIHGIRAKDLLDAPSFGEVAGDVLEMLSGAVIVGHNVSFDKAFLTSEFARIGVHGNLGKPLCTMRLGSDLRIQSTGRSLAAYCECLGVPLQKAHAAEHDAAASTSLLRAFLTLSRQRGVRALEDLDVDVTPVAAKGWPALQASGRVCRRDDAASARAPQSYLARLVRGGDPGVSVAYSPHVAAYFELLDRVLEDEIVTETEADGLAELAEISGLSVSAVRSAHERYLVALAVAALKDSVVTSNERRELQTVASLLGFDAHVVEDTLAEASRLIATPRLPVASDRARLAGTTVCFTGELVSHLRGVPISRELAQRLATDAGLKPVNGVTKALGLLVAADPYTMSGKGKKARQYGTRIMAEQAFWRAIGVEVG